MTEPYASSIPYGINQAQMRAGRPPVYGSGVTAPEVSHEPPGSGGGGIDSGGDIGGDTGGSHGGLIGGAIRSGYQRVRNEPTQVTAPSFLPSFTGNRRVLMYAAMLCAGIYVYDYWKNDSGLIPPSRFLAIVKVYGILMLASAYRPAVPLTNALGIGYALYLLWAYYGSSGPFAKNATPASSNTPASTAPATVAPGVTQNTGG